MITPITQSPSLSSSLSESCYCISNTALINEMQNQIKTLRERLDTLQRHRHVDNFTNQVELSEIYKALSDVRMACSCLQFKVDQIYFKQFPQSRSQSR